MCELFSFQTVGYRMCGFQCRNDTFQLTENPKSLQGFLVVNRGVLDAPDVTKIGMFRPDGRIVQSRLNAVSGRNLT